MPADAGAMVQVDAGAPPASCDPTESDALGPFFEAGAPERARIASPDEPGELLVLAGQLVLAPECGTPLADHVIDFWQADAGGEYFGAVDSDFRLRGQIRTSDEGRFELQTIMPGRYATSAGLRPAHIHLRVWTPEGVDRLVTQLYFEGDPYLYPNDGCGPPTCDSGDPARILALSPTTLEGAPAQRAEVRLVLAT